MSKSKGGLGRGLAALIPTGPSTNTVSEIFMGDAPQRREPAGDPEPADERSGMPSEPATSTANPSGPSIAASATASLSPPGAELGGPTSSGPTGSGVASGDPASGDPERGTDDQSSASVEPTIGPRYEEIEIARITPNPRNPREAFDPDALAELAHSIREFGLLQPVVVRPTPDGYELVMGERRWRAAQQAGLGTIPSIVRRTEDADLLRDALLENIHRSDLNPLEEAAAYQQLLAEFDVTHEELAARLGRSRPVISNTIRLLGLPVAVQRRVAAGVLSAGHARALLSLKDAGDQEDLAARVVAEGLSVRGTEEAVTLMARRTPTTRRATPKKIVMPGAQELAGNLSDAFDTRVLVELGRRKGRIVVEFATVDDLERIVGIMAPTIVRGSADRSENVEQVLGVDVR